MGHRVSVSNRISSGAGLREVLSEKNVPVQIPHLCRMPIENEEFDWRIQSPLHACMYVLATVRLKTAHSTEKKNKCRKTSQAPTSLDLLFYFDLHSSRSNINQVCLCIVPNILCRLSMSETWRRPTCQYFKLHFEYTTSRLANESGRAKQWTLKYQRPARWRMSRHELKQYLIYKINPKLWTCDTQFSTQQEMVNHFWIHNTASPALSCSSDGIVLYSRQWSSVYPYSSMFKACQISTASWKGHPCATRLRNELTHNYIN